MRFITEKVGFELNRYFCFSSGKLLLYIKVPEYIIY